MVNPSIFLGPTVIGIGVYLLSLKLSQIFHTNNSFSVSLEGLKSRYCVNSHISWYSRELSLLIWSWPRFILNRQSSQTMPSIWWIGNICHTNIYRLTNVLFSLDQIQAKSKKLYAGLFIQVLNLIFSCSKEEVNKISE